MYKAPKVLFYNFLATGEPCCRDHCLACFNSSGCAEDLRGSTDPLLRLPGGYPSRATEANVGGPDVVLPLQLVALCMCTLLIHCHITCTCTRTCFVCCGCSTRLRCALGARCSESYAAVVAAPAARVDAAPTHGSCSQVRVGQGHTERRGLRGR